MTYALSRFLQALDILDIKTFVSWQRDKTKNDAVTMMVKMRILSLRKNFLDWILLLSFSQLFLPTLA
jgi:hypothetical protein